MRWLVLVLVTLLSGEVAVTGEAQEIEEESSFVDVVIPPDDFVDAIPPDEDSVGIGVDRELAVASSKSGFLQEMIGLLKGLGMSTKYVEVRESPVVCNMTAALGCASYRKIEFASRLSSYSYEWKRFVAAHEYAHIVQIDQWSSLLSNRSYKTLYKSDIEHLADCMAVTKGVRVFNSKPCNSSQLSFARDVWGYKIDPRGNPLYRPLKTGEVVITGTATPGSTLRASAKSSGGYGKITTTYEWRVSGKAVGSTSSYKVKKEDVGKKITITVRKRDAYSLSSSVGNAYVFNTVQRLSGSDRYQTNYAVNAKYAERGKPVFVATGTNFADALSVTPSVVKAGGSLFLTSPKNSSTTVKKVNELNPSRVYLIGGPKLTSSKGYTSPVTRIYGKDRYETSVRIANHFFPNSEKVFVATGANYPDALSGGGVAGRLDAPILLVRKNTVTAETRAFLTKKEAVVLGGTGVVSSKVYSQIRSYSGKVTRLSGSDRYKTNQEIINYSLKNGGDGTRLFITTGRNYPDALSISAPSSQGVILLSKKSCVPDGNKYFAKASEVTLVGGRNVVHGTFSCN